MISDDDYAFEGPAEAPAAAPAPIQGDGPEGLDHV